MSIKFSGLRFFNKPGDLCSEFLRPEKNSSTSAGFEPANLGSRGEQVTPRPPRLTCLNGDVVVN